MNRLPSIEELTGILSDLTARLNRLEGQRAQSSPASPGSSTDIVTPFWDVTLCDGLTLTPAVGDDWSARFDDTAATLWRKVQLATKAGELDFGALGIGPQRRFAVTWDAFAPGTVKGLLCGFYTEAGDTDGYVQIKFNGVVTEYDTAHNTNDGDVFTLNVVRGRNSLIITADERPATLQFYSVLWDETRGDSFVDPRTLPGYLR